MCLESVLQPKNTNKHSGLCTNTHLLFLLSDSYAVPGKMDRPNVYLVKHFIPIFFLAPCIIKSEFRTFKWHEADFVQLQRWREHTTCLLTTFSFNFNLILTSLFILEPNTWCSLNSLKCKYYSDKYLFIVFNRISLDSLQNETSTHWLAEVSR